MPSKSKRQELKRRGSFREYAFLFAFGVVGFVLAGAAHQRGIARKWVTALLGTMLTFGFVIHAHRGRLLRSSVWVSLAICMAAHVLAIGIVFKYFLGIFSDFSPLLWFPVAFLEIWILLIATKRIQTRLTGQRETIRLNF
jgi:hypothetical protein